MKLLLILFSLFSSTLWAQSWTVGSQVIEVAKCPEQYCLISKSCLGSAKNECQALKAMKNKIQSDAGPGGSNPGSSVCQKHYKAHVFVAKDSTGNEVAFCRFSDDSFLSLDGLWRW